MSGVPASAVRGRSNLPLVLAGSAAFSISTMFSSMKPVLITRFVEEAGYPAGLAGLAAAMPFVGGVAASALLPAMARRIDGARVVTGLGAGLALAEAGNATWAANPALLLTGQFVAGICGGMLMGLVSQSIAVSERSEQTFGIVDMVGVLLMSLMVAAFGAAVERAGLRGGFLAAAAMSAGYAAVLHLSRTCLPDRTAHGVAAAGAPLNLGWRDIAVIAMGVAFVTFSGLGFAFMVTQARALGMGYELASSAIGLILLLSAGGCLAGGWCAARFGARAPLLAAFALCGLGWYIAFHTPSQAVFLAALLPAIVALQFCFPILLSLAGTIDPDGRVAAIAAPIIVSGFAWAAILAGLIVGQWGTGALSLVTIGGMVLCALLLLASERPATQP